MTCFVSAAFAQTQPTTPVLVIYTYDSFLAEWGPGPELKRNFELTCKCKVSWVAAADGAALLARLKIEGRQTKADLVVGLDHGLLWTADSLDVFTDSGLGTQFVPAETTKFVKYDYGYYTFMFDTKSKQKNGSPFPKPKSLKELLSLPELNGKVLIQDPRSSTTGFGLLLWINEVYDMGKKPNTARHALESLKRQTLKVSKGWSESYNLFTKGEAPLVFSYTTSEAYHREIEKETRYEALIFPEGHYIAYELAGVLKTSKNISLARDFIKFLLTEDSQRIIANKNWMYPIKDIKSGLADAFKQIKTPKLTLGIHQEVIEKYRRTWISEWEKVFLQ